jgi:hypothetical protein
MLGRGWPYNAVLAALHAWSDVGLLIDCILCKLQDCLCVACSLAHNTPADASINKVDCYKVCSTQAMR